MTGSHWKGESLIPITPEDITSLLLSVLLRVCTTPMAFGIARYYDNNFSMQTFDFIVCSDKCT